MEKLPIIIDTSILISAFRGNEKAKNILEKLKGRIGISVITELEQYAGATTNSKKKEISKQLSAFCTMNINEEICTKAVSLFKKYVRKNRKIYIQDTLIASSCIILGLEFITFNLKDFELFNELNIYNLSSKNL